MQLLYQTWFEFLDFENSGRNIALPSPDVFVDLSLIRIEGEERKRFS
jgi:hypothetical protein